MEIEQELRRVLRYEQETGFLYWTDQARKNVRGMKAGKSHVTGYIIVTYRGKCFKAHRVAWLLINGEWPKQNIDHIDGDKTNNRISNLRDVDCSTNEQNKAKARIDSKSGLIGASPYRKRWKSQIRVNGEVKYLGVFDTAEMAHQAYIEAKKIYYPGWAQSHIKTS